MKSFEYLRPESLAQLLTLMRLHGSGARLLAGGTDLVVRMRKGSEPPRAVIDLKRVAELRDDIIESNGVIRIGARAVMTDIIASPFVRHHCPALVEAAIVVGSIQIRNRATMVGNLCNASPAADTAPSLLAYGAGLNLVSDTGRRHMPLDEFFAGPGRTVLVPGEIVESIDVPLPASGSGSAFERITRRRGVDLAIVSVSCLVSGTGAVRFAFGAVGPRPFVVASRADAPLDDILARARPISDLRASDDYRSAMLQVLARRALKTATMRLQTSRERRGASGSPQASGWSGAGGPRD